MTNVLEKYLKLSLVKKLKHLKEDVEEFSRIMNAQNCGTNERYTYIFERDKKEILKLKSIII